ncbi:MAG: PBECR4 domain-containing protein [Blautia sp.]|nr:PBECR4 domain-containing protein [Lachnoclostridium sp.]MCM1210719.1 PBECR4 domain-containing protein [Blautia sp.]
MDNIQKSAVHFFNLINTTSYVFHLANRNVRVVSLNFMMKDFHHVAGLQYLTDINIPRNRKNTISWILNKDNPITDKYLAQSKFYKGKPNDEKDIESRIEQLCFLEQYLDENNIIRIYSPKDGPQNNSVIECDYIIESQLTGSHTIVYIFLKYRHGIGSPCTIISFGVKKNVAYGGQNLYWMLKDKIVNGVRQTIYQHPKYSLEQKLKNEPNISSI